MTSFLNICGCDECNDDEADELCSEIAPMLDGHSIEVVALTLIRIFEFMAETYPDGGRLLAYARDEITDIAAGGASLN
jgi:hypothetical protein